jgi:hypothetical protein
MVTNQNYIHEKIKSRLNLGNICYCTVQNVKCSCLISKNVKITIYKIIILPTVLNGCKTWSLTSREEHTLNVFEKRVLRRVSGSKRHEETGDWGKVHNEEINNLFSTNIMIKSRRMR